MYKVAGNGRVKGADGRKYKPGEAIPLNETDAGRLLRIGAVMEIHEEDSHNAALENNGNENEREMTPDADDVPAAGGSVSGAQEPAEPGAKKSQGRRAK